MKLLTFEYRNETEVGVLCQDRRSILPIKQAGLPFSSMNELILKASPEQLELLRRQSAASASSLSLDQVTLLAPIPVPRQDIICLGINYAAHAEESARYKGETYEKDRQYAVYFSKRVNEAVGQGAPIQGHFDLLERLDYEAELAVIIGKDASNVNARDAFDYVFGYTILNDISAREIQTRHKQWYFGKSMDGFCPMGPWIATEDEFSRPPVLHISSRVNGELRQDSSTGLLIFSIPQVIEELSRGMVLKAGTIISMGTPAGAGMGFDPPRFLKSGDVVECQVEGIGTLSNPVA